MLRRGGGVVLGAQESRNYVRDLWRRPLELFSRDCYGTTRDLSFQRKQTRSSSQPNNPRPSPFLTSIVLDKMQAFSRCAAPALRAASRQQRYSTATAAYAATAENLRITKDTKVIYQGFTGKQGT